VTAVGYGECQIIAGIEPYADYCKVIVAEKWMALTFDDGPGDGTPRLLEGLRERDAYASFFVIGTMAEGRKDTLRQIVDYGHDLGNHTYNHRYTGEGLHEDLALTDAIIIDAIGYPSVLMRPPGGYIFDSTRNCGKAIVMWSIDPRDWEVRNADTVYNNIMTEAFSGAVVVMHDIYDTSIESALWVIDALKDQGYTFVTISDMFDYPEPNRICTQGYSTVRPRKWMVPDWPGRPPE
jgi:peptidoglycan/xylan/chitin deacetylase (PgdA/CDA1 family)